MFEQKVKFTIELENVTVFVLKILWHVACSYNLFKDRRFVTQNMKVQHKIHEEMFRTESLFIPPISRLVI
jgi:hypothetical protein